MRTSTKPLPGTAILPGFPDSDGRPMGDTDFHTQALIWLREALEDFFSGLAGWYVATNLIVYWDRTNPRKRRDPDVLVARVSHDKPRRSFRVWEEKTVPRALFEVLSKKTWRVDMGPKKEEYARVGVPEYFLFDPEIMYLNPPLQGFRLRKGVYVPIEPESDGTLKSKTLGLRMRNEERMLRLIDPRTGAPIPTRTERIEQERWRAEESRRRVDEERRQTEEERRRTEEERRRADELSRRVEEERQRAELAELQLQAFQGLKEIVENLAAEMTDIRDRLNRLNGAN